MSDPINDINDFSDEKNITTTSSSTTYLAINYLGLLLCPPDGYCNNLKYYT